MNYKCYNCGAINHIPDSEINPGHQGRYFCATCRTPNIISFENNGITSCDNMPGAIPPPPPMPPKRNNHAISPLVWVLLALAVAIGIFAAYYFISNNKNNENTELIDEAMAEEDQKLAISSFYNNCVFETPTVKMVEDALTPHMLGQIKETDTRFAMYKFLTGKNPTGSGESRLTDIITLGDNRFRVNYLDKGQNGSSILTMVLQDDKWKIDNVEYINDTPVQKAEVKEEVEKNVTYTDSYDYSGIVDGKYSIRATITFTPDGNGYRVSGKYAYLTTLSKYGDKSTSWIHVSGRTHADGSISWTESIVGNAGYDSRLNGVISPNFRHIEGSLGGDGDHYIELDN